jgi:hypothetical protein
MSCTSNLCLKNKNYRKSHVFMPRDMAKICLKNNTHVQSSLAPLVRTLSRSLKVIPIRIFHELLFKTKKKLGLMLENKIKVGSIYFRLLFWGNISLKVEGSQVKSFDHRYVISVSASRPHCQFTLSALLWQSKECNLLIY